MPNAPPAAVAAPTFTYGASPLLLRRAIQHDGVGDLGLARVFRRLHACLRIGGRLVLEPQPWKSYRKRATLTPTIAQHFRDIRMRPSGFADVLLSSAVGFRRCERLEVPYDEGAAEGFKRRPMLVLTK